ncbi:transposase [Chryseobacterium soli]|uniref:Transposase n=1 Tax=Chryseobacterium soli TaxID=445961 RepID=A0A086A306_9FLAO|nr:site-specific integrase [Chryseobacterium soli]KFF11070.1 transposase [Chryseobacterium soli]
MKIYLMKRNGQLSKKNAEKGKPKMNSLFLMYHDTDRKIRNYEFLQLYLYDKPKNETEKLHNKETSSLGEAIKAKRVLDMQSRRHGFVSSTKGKIGFLKYFKTLVDKRFEVSGTHGNWNSAYKHLQKFCKNKDISIENIDDLFLESFKDYLLNQKVSKHSSDKLAQNTALSYFNKVKTALKEAYQSKMIKENPVVGVKGIKEKETNRQYLILDELQKLAKTECYYPIMKDAFLFSALTGLRFSDIKNLTWKNLSYDAENGWMLKYTQKKTKGAEHLPIAEQAVKILEITPETLRTKDVKENVFANLKYSAYQNKKLHKWVEDAGIDKHITFHSARHSFATLQLTMDTDIYTVSKLLGHRHLKTTEIYAKVIDKKKINAVSKMPELYI